MDRLNELTVFVRAVDEGGFSAAGRSLGMTPSAVSKLIARLEQRLGTALFTRTLRDAVLTAEGETLYANARRAIEAVEAAEASVSSSRTVSGTLRVRSIPTFGTHQLAPLVPAFKAQYPNLHLEFVLTMQPGNLLDGGVDVAIQIGPLTDSSLVARRITGTRWLICASPDYVSKHGMPCTPADLVHHQCLNFPAGSPGNVWRGIDDSGTIQPLKIASTVTANTGQMLLSMALAGVGIVRLAEYHVASDLRAGRLVEVLSQYNDSAEDPIHAVYSSRRLLSQRIRAFLDFLDQQFAQNPPRWNGADEANPL